MPEEFTAKTGRSAARTLLTPGESTLLYRLRGELKTDNESDTIRQALRRLWKELGWII